MKKNKLTTLELKNGTVKVNKASLITSSTFVLTHALITTTAYFSYNSDPLLHSLAILLQGFATTYIENSLNGTEAYIESRIK